MNWVRKALCAVAANPELQCLSSTEESQKGTPYFFQGEMG